MRWGVSVRSLILLIAMASALPQSAVADSAAPARVENSAPDEGDRLQEITVTATRRSESVEKVPISINALSQDDLTQGAIKSISDIASVTPGLEFGYLGYASTLTEISIRGMDSLFGASTVGLYLDDTPIQGRLSSDGNVGNPYPAVFDLNRIEVLRGPQGTLFGAGSEAGNIRFITNQPSLAQFSGFSHAEVSSTQDGAPSYEVGAAAGGPIVAGKLGFRASIWDQHSGGYVDRANPWNADVVDRNTNQSHTLATKLAFGINANDVALITPSVFYQQVRGFDSGRFDLAFSNPSAGQFNSVTLLPETWRDFFVIPSLKLEATLPFADLTAIVSYMRRKVDLESDLSGLVGAIGLVNYGNPLGPSYASSPSDVSPLWTGTSVHAFTEEVRLTSNQPGAFLTWVAGIFNDHRTQTDYQLQRSLLIDPTGNEIFYTLQSVRDEQIAAFAQGDLHLTGKWTATLGLRVAKVKTDQTNVNGTGALDAVPPFAETNLSQTPTTPRVSVSYQPDKSNMLYVTASKGFRIGGGNDPLPAVCGYTAVPRDYTADYIWNYEVGAKDKLFDGRVEIDTSAFHIVWSNIQQLAQPSCGISYTFNAGSAVSNGFDLALQAIPIDRLKLDLAVAYADAHFTTNVYDSQGNVLVQNGDKIGWLPWTHSPWDVNTAANYEIPFGQGAKLHLRAEYQYHSSNPGPFVNRITNSPSYSPQDAPDPPTHLTNARVGVTMANVDVGVFVDNVFNSHPLLAKYGQAVLSAPTYGTFRPRTVGLSANVTF
jgi:iron complex outermembrane recepter protein